MVLGAIETISTAHLHMLGSKPFGEAGDMHSRSLRSLSTHLSSCTMDGASAEIALTATLLLVYYEVNTNRDAAASQLMQNGSRSF